MGVAAAVVLAVATSACGAGKKAEDFRQVAEEGLFTKESTTTTTIAARVPEAALAPTAGLAACVDWSGSVAASSRLALRSVLASAVQSLNEGIDPSATGVRAGARPLLLSARVVDENSFGDSSTTNVIASAEVPGVHEVVLADPLGDGSVDLPVDHLVTLTDAHAAAEARWKAEARARIAAVEASATLIASFERPPSNRTDNLGCLSAQAAWLQGRDIVTRRLVVLGDLIDSGAQNLDRRLDGVEILAIQVCTEAEECVEARDRFASRVAELGGTFLEAIRLDDPKLAAQSIVQGLR